MKLLGTTQHKLTKTQAISDAKQLVKHWKKPFYVYFNEAANTWDYDSEKPTPIQTWKIDIQQITE